MTVNKNNIDRLIEKLRPDDGAHFHMGAWTAYLEEGKPLWGRQQAPEHHEVCMTTYCLCGHVNFLILTEDEKRDAIDFKCVQYPNGKMKNYVEEMANSERAATWLGIDYEAAEKLFWMYSSRTTMRRDDFDKLPPDIRAEAAIATLEHLRDTGEVSWRHGLKAALSPQQFAEIDISEWRSISKNGVNPHA